MNPASAPAPLERPIQDANAALKSVADYALAWGGNVTIRRTVRGFEIATSSEVVLVDASFMSDAHDRAAQLIALVVSPQTSASARSVPASALRGVWRFLIANPAIPFEAKPVGKFIVLSPMHKAISPHVKFWHSMRGEALPEYQADRSYFDEAAMIATLALIVSHSRPLLLTFERNGTFG